MIAKLTSLFTIVLVTGAFFSAESREQQVIPNMVTPNKVAAGTAAGPKNTSAKVQTAAQSSPMMPMSLVAPLFVEDANTANTLTIVHDAGTQTVAQISIVNLQGQQIAAFSKPITTHGQTIVALADEFLKLGITGPVIGSLIATPTPSNVSLAGQLSIIRKNVSPAEDIEEELPMIDTSKKNTFTALATGSSGQPVVALHSSSLEPQTLAITCIIQGQQPQQNLRVLAPNQGLFIDPCKGQDVPFTLTNPQKTFSTPKVIGVSITSSAMPGSLSLFGPAPRAIGALVNYEPLQFHQAGATGPLSNVYPGIPLGPTADLQGIDFQPEVGLTNFAATPAHVTIALAKGNTGTAQPIATLTVPANSAVSVPFPETAGDPGMANTVTIQSDEPDSQLVSNLRAVSMADHLTFVELPAQNPSKNTNGGQHPWALSATMNSKLFLYNASPDNVTPSVRIYSGSQLWVQPVNLAPFETKVVDIRALFDNAVKDSKGQVLSAAPGSNVQGIVGWASLKSKSIHGRVLQFDRNTLLTRNFSCELVYIACGAALSPGSLFSVISANGEVLGGAMTCPSIGQCTCDGSSCPGGFDQADSYYWFTYSPDIASVISGSFTSIATIHGTSVGSTTLNLSVSDVNGCDAEGDGPVTVAKCPPTTTVIGGPYKINNSVFPTGLGSMFQIEVAPPLPTNYDYLTIGESGAKGTGSTCSDEVQNLVPACTMNDTFTVGADGVDFSGTYYPPIPNSFWDQHALFSTIDVLLTAHSDPCQIVCTQTYTCNGNQIGPTHTVTYSLSHQNGVGTVVAAAEK